MTAKAPPAFQDAKRTQTSFFAPLEKRCLIWLAEHMPAWVNSDHLTVIGFLSMAAAGLSYWYAGTNPLVGLTLVTLCLAVNWFGDSLDGTLARVRKKLRPRYGFYVDHIVDCFGAFFLLGGLSLSGFMSPTIAFGLLIVFLMLSIEVYLATYTLGHFQISFWKFSPTELRILLAIGNFALLFKPYSKILGRQYLMFDVGGFIGIIGMTVMLLISVARHTAALYRAEPLT